VTWTKSKHTIKLGGDFRHSGSLFTQVFKDYQLGSYAYNGSTLGGFLGNGAATPLASLLLGYPDQTTIGSVLNPATDAQQNSYAVFAQDDWKVSSSLTINFGLRWEYHPGFHDINNNITNWVPDYVSTVDGQTVHGASILPNQAAFANVNPQFAASIYPTPIILASKVGLGESLRENSKKDFAPRVGFAYRLGGSNKTVLRGGY
jgi:outer membrane receptor protein involved in Fe transport